MNNNYKADLERFRKADNYTLVNFISHALDSGDLERPIKLLTQNAAWIEAQMELFLNGDIDSNHSLLIDIAKISNILKTFDTADSIVMATKLHTVRHLVNLRLEGLESQDLKIVSLIGNYKQALSQARKIANLAERCDAMFEILLALDEHNAVLIIEQILHETFDYLKNLTDPIDYGIIANKAFLTLIRLKKIAESKKFALEAIQRLDGYKNIEERITFTNYGLQNFKIEGEPNEELNVIFRLNNVFSIENLKVKIIESYINYHPHDNIDFLIDKVNIHHIKLKLLTASRHNIKRDNILKDRRIIINESEIISSISNPFQKAFSMAHLLIFEPDNQLLKEQLEIVLVDIFLEVDKFLQPLETKFSFVRNQGLYNVNLVFYVENLCEISKELYKANIFNLLSKIEEKVNQIINRISSIELLFDEQPILYIEEFIGQKQVQSNAYFGRQDDARLYLLQLLYFKKEYNKAKRLYKNIEHPIVQSIVTYKYFLHLISNNQLRVVLKNIQNYVGLPMVSYLGEEKFRVLTNFNRNTFLRSSYTTQTYLYRKIIEYFLVNNQLNKAKSLFESKYLEIPLEINKDFYRLFAHYYVKNNKYEDAKECLYSIQINSIKHSSINPTYVLSELISVLVNDNYTSKAAELLECISNKQIKNDIRTKISISLSKKPDSKEESLNILMEMANDNKYNKDSFLKVCKFGIIGKNLHQIGYTDLGLSYIEEAINSFNNIDNEGIRSEAIRITADCLFAVKDSAKVDVLYKEALNTSVNIFPRWNRIYNLKFIAESMYKSGRVVWMKEIVDDIIYELGLRYPRAHSSMALEIIKTLVEIEEYDRAVSLASTIKDDFRYGNIFIEAIQIIILSLIKKKQYSYASNLQMVLLNPFDALHTMSMMSISLKKDGQFENSLLALNYSLSLMDKVEINDQKEQSKIKLAYVLAELDMIEDSLNLISKISNLDYKKIALENISSHLPVQKKLTISMELIDCQTLEKYLLTLISWKEFFTEINFYNLIENILKIVSWYRPDWQEIYNYYTKNNL